MKALTELNLEFRFSKKHREEFLWPADDVWAWKWLNKKENWDLPVQISNLCKDNNLVIQAGGNAGLYPKLYGKIFKSVITFEPDYRNFFCLCHNVTDSNVSKIQSAIGNNNEPLSMNVNVSWNESNRGALKAKPGGIIPQLTIDSLGLAPSLIHLDIEGFEGFALEGAKYTIKTHKPMIVLETNGSGDEYGWPQTRIDSMLESWGYKILLKWDHDTVYTHENY